jgi:anti-sigma factor RsiW
MECILPPPITDDQISAALDGLADPTVQNHIAQCPGCAVRIEQAQSLEATLKRTLNRWDCPPSQRLGEYVLALIANPSAERSIIRHLDQCARCKAEVAELGAFLSADTASVKAQQPVQQPARAEAAWGQSFGRILARIIPRSPALALRGAATGPIMAEADGTTVVLDVQRVAEGQVTILGQVVAADQDLWTGALVELRQSGAIQATTTADDLGSFSCGPFAAGPIQLAITPPVGQTVVLPQIDVAAQG